VSNLSEADPEAATRFWNGPTRVPLDQIQAMASSRDPKIRKAGMMLADHQSGEFFRSDLDELIRQIRAGIEIPAPEKL